MKFIDWSAHTQVRRIGVSFVCASLSAWVVSFVFQLPLIPYPKTHMKLDDTVVHLKFRSVIIILVLVLLLLHLMLCWRHRTLERQRMVQFSLSRLLVCMIGLSLFVGANFLPALTTTEGRSLGGQRQSITTVTTFGFPAQSEVLRKFDHMPSKTSFSASTLSPVGIAINSLILLLFMANVLVLKFVKTENAASATESAPQNASH